ncbi:cupin-like domain-containing protein [Pseudoduganella sp. UC29_106]|uniref:cupin-like domain-containing protein n=1 Tax=Pseudoduganella sp. UC29_106 TaxID=3374553 RepID=UPI003756ED47
MLKPIRELSGLRPADLSDELLTSTEPLVLRGLAAEWPLVKAGRASQQAASDYLRRYYRGEKVIAMLGAPDIGGRFFYNEDLSGFNFASVRTGLGGVLDELAAHRNAPQPPAIYVGSTEVDGCLPGLRAENDLDLGARQPYVSIWLGNQTRIAAHYDLPDNIACVAAGRRRFTLFPPGQLGNLYIGPLDFTPAGQAISLVDFHRPDLARFPRFATALEHAQSAELEAGDAIFIPSMWWHHVEALDPFNILVNYWWRQSPGYMDTPTNTLMLALMTMRELPPAQRAAWQELFRHYVFDSDGSEAAHIPPGARGVLAPLDDAAARALRGQILNRMNR